MRLLELEDLGDLPAAEVDSIPPEQQKSNCMSEMLHLILTTKPFASFLNNTERFRIALCQQIEILARFEDLPLSQCRQRMLKKLATS